jgi:hypothetical protein
MVCAEARKAPLRNWRAAEQVDPGRSRANDAHTFAFQLLHVWEDGIARASCNVVVPAGCVKHVALKLWEARHLGDFWIRKDSISQRDEVGIDEKVLLLFLF